MAEDNQHVHVRRVPGGNLHLKPIRCSSKQGQSTTSSFYMPVLINVCPLLSMPVAVSSVKHLTVTCDWKVWGVNRKTCCGCLLLCKCECTNHLFWPWATSAQTPACWWETILKHIKTHSMWRIYEIGNTKNVVCWMRRCHLDCLTFS